MAEVANQSQSTQDVGEIVTLVKDMSGRLDKFASRDDIKVYDNKLEDLKKTLEKAVLAGGKQTDAAAWNGWSNGADFLKAVLSAGIGNPDGQKIDERLLKAPTGMNLTSGPEGGYTLPPAFSTQILEKVIGDSESLMGLCDGITLDGVESMTLLANAETSRANGSRWGGTIGYWKSEAAQMSGSKPQFRQVRVEPHELYVMTYVTDKMLRNSPVAIEGYIARAAADEINFKVGDAIFEGTGAGQPLGIKNSPCKITIAKEASQANDTVVIENVRKMWNRLPIRSRSRAIWLAHQDVEPQLEGLHQAVKNVAGTENVGGSLAWGYYNPEKNTLKGRPIKYIEYADTLGDEGDLMLWDPMSYVVARRGGMNAAMSMHLRFDYAETAFRWIFEVDGQPYLNKEITPFKGTNTLSPIISLAAR